MTLPLGPNGFHVDLTHDFRSTAALARSKKLMQTQLVNTGGVDNPPYSESYQDCRTSKRISAYG